MKDLLRFEFPYSRGRVVLSFDPGASDAPVLLNHAGPLLFTIEEAHRFSQELALFMRLVPLGTFVATDMNPGPKHSSFPPTHVERRTSEIRSDLDEARRMASAGAVPSKLYD